MTGSRPAEILRHLEQSGFAADASPGDAELLARFVRQRDQAAFALLVRRHGPLVFAVCRRITANTQDAEDAFQAVFLVLARKAGRITHPALLGNWLYGVAVRVARRARRSATRRRAREVQVAVMPEASVSRDAPDDIGPLLHEELAALPAWYREPIVLCDLREFSRADAATALGIPEGTLSSRLVNGRKKLAARLARRGIVCSAPALPALLVEGRATAGVPEELVTKTCGLVADWSAGAAVPASVSRLATGGLPVRKLLLLGAFTIALTAAGAVLANQASDPPNPADPPKPPDPPVVKADPPAVPPADPKPDEKATGFTTTPKLRKATDIRVTSVNALFWSPDGKRVALQGTGSASGNPGAAPVPGLGSGGARNVAAILDGRNAIFVVEAFPVEEGQSPRWLSLPQPSRLLGFTPDGKYLLTDRREYNLVSGFHHLMFWEEKQPPAAGGAAFAGGGGFSRVRTVELDADQTVGYAFAPDGKTFRTVYREASKPGVIGLIEVRQVSAETGKTLKTLVKVEGEYLDFTLSANGKRLAVQDAKLGIDGWNVDKGGKESSPREQLKVAGGGFAGGGFPASVRTSILLSPDSRFLLVSDRINGLQVFDNESGKWAPKPESNTRLDPDPYISRECFSADGRLLVLTGSESAQRDGPGGGPGTGPPREFLKVWETATGKQLKSWPHRPMVAWSPTAPVLAVVENNSEGGTRLGLWDFAAELPEKK